VRVRRAGGGVDVAGPGGDGEEAGDLRDRACHARPDQARYRWVLAAVWPVDREEVEAASFYARGGGGHVLRGGDCERDCCILFY
jgi:hypothetical protein